MRFPIAVVSILLGFIIGLVVLSATKSSAAGPDPIIRQIAVVVNPATNRIHLFGVTNDGKVLQFEQRTGQWIPLDQADAGFLNEIDPGTKRGD